jgi:tetratricopeptide (TPR) repeat protein
MVQGTLNISAAPRTFSPCHQLPPPPTVFTGRDEELRELLVQLGGGDASGAAIAVTAQGLQGMGGVGKTALALVLAHELKARYPGGQLYRDLRGADPDRRAPLTPTEVMRDFIRALRPKADDRKLPEELDQLSPTYHSLLREIGGVLLLLDNAADAAQVQALRPPPGCLLLVTSRRHLNLPGLAVRDLDCLAPDEAAALLLELAPRVATQAPEAARLCGGLPLALEVFAGAINDQSLTPVPELLARLHAGEEKLPQVEAAFTVSKSLLPEETRTAWHLLSVFTASFDLPAAAAVWEKEPAAARATLQVLVNASLVEFNADNARFRLHDLARHFCDRRLSEPQREEARLRHARHYIAVGYEGKRLYMKGGEHVLAGLRLFDRERVHLEAAFAWLQPLENAPSAALLVWLVDAVGYVGDLRFHPRQRIDWLEAQRIAARLAGNREAEGCALGNLGRAYADLDEAQKAIEFYEQALVVSREIGDRRAEGFSFDNLGLANVDLGDARKAIAFHKQALAISREIADRRAEGGALGNLGNAYFALGDTRKAIEFHEQALAVSREIGERRREGDNLGNLGNAYVESDDARKAIDFHKQDLEIRRQIGDRRGEGNALGNLGIASRNLGDARKAIEFFEQARIIAREIGDRRAEGNALGNLGNAYADLGDARKAIEFYERRLVLAREIGDRRGEGGSSFSMATKLWSTGERERALELMQTAWKIWTAIEHPRAHDARALLQKWRGSWPTAHSEGIIHLGAMNHDG